MVLRRSTMRWMWPSAFSRAARSMVTFIDRFPRNPVFAPNGGAAQSRAAYEKGGEFANAARRAQGRRAKLTRVREAAAEVAPPEPLRGLNPARLIFDAAAT